MANDTPERWLGQLVLELQKASDRVAGRARARADWLIADATAEAESIREIGGRRAREMNRIRALMHLGPEEASRPLIGDVTLVPAPPVPRSRLEGSRQPFPADPQLSPSPSPSPSAPSPEVATRPVPVSVPCPADQPPRGPRPRVGPVGIRPVALLAAAAIIAASLGLNVFERYGTAARERAAQRHLAAKLAVAEAALPTGAGVASGAAFGFLSIPRLAVIGEGVIEGATQGNLHQGPAHDSSSQLPGEGGAVILVGHRRSYGGPFARLGQLRVGDVISLRTPAGLYVYRVSRPLQVLAGARSVFNLPPPTPSQSTGTSALNQQSLLLATSGNSEGTSLAVVVATLDQAGMIGTPGSVHRGETVAELRSVPGDRAALLFLLCWLGILGAGPYLGRRLVRKVPTGWVVAGGSVVMILATYQAYLAVDRLLPGTY